MNRLMPISVIALFAVSGILAQAQADLADKIEALQPSVVTLLVHRQADSTAAESSGTGWFIEDGQIVTNFHVIRNARRVVVRLADGTEFDSSHVVGADADRDVAIIATNLKEKTPKPLTLSPRPPRVGESIFVIGSPQGFELTASEGIVSALRQMRDIDTIQMTAAISAGSSGSPVFAQDSTVIGVATSTWIDGQSLNFAMPVKFIRELKRSKIEWTDWSKQGAVGTGQSNFGPKEQASYYDALFTAYAKECKQQMTKRPLIFKATESRVGHFSNQDVRVTVLSVLDEQSALFHLTGGTEVFRIGGIKTRFLHDDQELVLSADKVFIRTGAYRYTAVQSVRRSVLSLSVLDKDEFHKARVRYTEQLTKEVEARTAARDAARTNLDKLRSESDIARKGLQFIQDLDTRMADLREKLKIYEGTKDRPNIAPLYEKLKKDMQAISDYFQENSDAIRNARTAGIEAESRVAEASARLNRVDSDLKEFAHGLSLVQGYAKDAPRDTRDESRPKEPEASPPTTSSEDAQSQQVLKDFADSNRIVGHLGKQLIDAANVEFARMWKPDGKTAEEAQAYFDQIWDRMVREAEAKEERQQPTHGERLWISGKVDERDFDRRLTIKNEHNFGVLVQLQDTTSQQFIQALFIKPRSSLAVKLPSGTFRVFYAFGAKWYGERGLFGPTGSYLHVISTFDLTRPGNNSADLNDDVKRFSIPYMSWRIGEMQSKR